MSLSRAPVLSWRPNTFKFQAPTTLAIFNKDYSTETMLSTEIDSIVFLQFSNANVKCTKSFDKNVCKKDFEFIDTVCGSSLLG